MAKSANRFRSFALRLAFRGLFLAAFSSRAGAAEIDILISKDIGMYRDAATSLAQQLAPRTVTIHSLDSDNPAEIKAALEQVQTEKPKILVAVGSKAAEESVQKFPAIPLVYLMVVYPGQLGLTLRDSAYGISWLPSDAALIRTILLLAPKARRIGMVSSCPPADLSRFQRACEESGLALTVSPFEDASGLPQSLRNLHGKLDVLWMGSDALLANKDAFRILSQFALEERVPFIVPFSPAEPRQVLAGISVTPKIAASAAKKIARQLLEGNPPREALTFSDDVEVTVDLTTARDIGFQVPETALRNAAKVLGP